MTIVEMDPSEHFLNLFFAPPNHLSLTDIETLEKLESLRLWVNRIRNGLRRPTVLPYWSKSKVIYYAFAFSDADLREFAAELTAFIGPSFSDLSPARAELDAEDPLESALLQFTEGRVLKFCGDSNLEFRIASRKISARLSRLHSIDCVRPKRGPRLGLAQGSVLKDFYMALQVGNRQSAEQHLGTSQLRSLTILNQLFLRARLLCEVGTREELYQWPHLHDVLQIRRPIAVSEALIRALYRWELTAFELRGEAEAAKQHFVSELLPRFASLYMSSSGHRSSEAAKSFMLLAAHRRDFAKRSEILERSDLPDDDYEWLIKLADLFPPATGFTATRRVTDIVQAAYLAERDEDYQRAFALMADAPHSVAQFNALCRYAYELQTLECCEFIRKAFGAMPLAQRNEILATRSTAKFLEDLIGDPTLGLLPDPIPSSWLEWLEAIAKRPNWRKAVDIGRAGATEWSAEDFSSQENLTRVTVLLNEVVADERFQYTIPHFLESLQRDPQWPRREFLELYANLLAAIEVGTSGSSDDLRAWATLAEACFTLGIEPQQADAVFNAAVKLWRKYASLHLLDWALDLLDLLSQYPRRAVQQRDELLSAVIATMSEFSRHVSPEQFQLASLIARDFGQAEMQQFLNNAQPIPREFESPTTSLATLEGKMIAIYTLSEGAARHAVERLALLFPGAKVRCSHDKVCGTSLQKLAQIADIFVVATSSAKHAATICIDQYRNNRPTLYAKGKGVSSILSALRTAVSQ